MEHGGLEMTQMAYHLGLLDFRLFSCWLEALSLEALPGKTLTYYFFPYEMQIFSKVSCQFSGQDSPFEGPKILPFAM